MCVCTRARAQSHQIIVFTDIKLVLNYILLATKETVCYSKNIADIFIQILISDGLNLKLYRFQIQIFNFLIPLVYVSYVIYLKMEIKGFPFIYI